MIDANKQLKINPNLDVSKTKYMKLGTWVDKLWGKKDD